MTQRRRSRSTPDLSGRRLLPLLLAAAAATAALSGCAPATPQPLCRAAGAITDCGTATGVVIAVEGDGPASVAAFSLRTAAGDVLVLAVERLDVTGGGKPAPHLREHQLDGLPITVEYKVEGGRHVALRYTDAE